jgi:GMP synthase-like glutamine amidotransferase
MILVIDNTLNQDQYFPLLMGVLSCTYKVIQSESDLRSVREKDVTGILISGSPLMVTKKSIRDNIDQFALNTFCIMRYDVPILGICFGCQLINVIFGGNLRKLRSHFCQDSEVKLSKERISGRFCLRYIINKVSPMFKTVGLSVIRGDNVPCMIKHKTRKIYGCLFHPEFHPKTHYIIKDFLQECKMHK